MVIDAEVVQEEIGGAVEVVGTASLAAITRGEIDTQIATAKQYPRSIAVFKRRAIEMATLDEETAESCIYSRPVGTKNGKTEYAEGLSIRMAEIVGASYGNIRVGSMITEMTDRKVVARGVCFDLESNFASTTEVAESTVTKSGAPYSERMRMVVAKATLAKAWRDALFKVVPKALCRPVEVEVRKLLAGDGSAASISKRRSRVIQWLRTLGIDMARVFSALGVKGEEDIGLDQLDTLTGIKTALRDKEITVDEAFPVAGEAADSKGGAAALVEKLKSSKKPAPEPAADAPQPTPSSAPSLIFRPASDVSGKRFEDAIAAIKAAGFVEDASGALVGPDSQENYTLLDRATVAKYGTMEQIG